MSYMDQNWLEPLMSELNRRSPQSWTFDEDNMAHGRGVSPQVRWRKSGWVKGRKAWVIHDDIEKYVLLFSLVEEDGAIKGSKGIRPVLILETEDERVLYKKVFKKPHNKADAKLGLGGRDGKLEYNLKPHISDLVEALVSPYEKMMMTLFKVDDVPMLGEEVFEEYGYAGVHAMRAVIKSRDIELIGRKHVVELLGIPTKKAMAIRVAKLAMKRASKSFYEVTFDTTLKGEWADTLSISYPKTFDLSSERDLERSVEGEYEKYASVLWNSDSFNPKKIVFDKIGVFGLRFVMSTQRNTKYSFTISIHSEQVSDEDLLQILKHGTFFSHALRHF